MRTAPRPEAAEHTDLSPLRRCVAHSCDREGVCDFDTVNTWITLKRTAADVENFSAEYCKRGDLSPGRLSVLMVLNTYPEKPMPLSEIGEYLIVSRPNITGLIDGLVEDGLVKRIDHPEDRRMILAQLTPQGREFMRKFVPAYHSVVQDVTSVLTRHEKRQLVMLLDKLRANLRRVKVPQTEEI